MFSCADTADRTHPLLLTMQLRLSLMIGAPDKEVHRVQPDQPASTLAAADNLFAG